MATYLKGIDVSWANGSIDWTKVKKEVDFAIIRSTFGSDYPSQIDNCFIMNANGCVKNNIPFATYHFAYFVDEKTAKDEADFAIKKANLYKDYVKFIALDIEEDSVAYADRMGKKPNWTKCAIAFMERVKSAGFTPVLYSNQSWLTNVLDYNQVKKYKLWYAAPDVSAPKYNPAIWQYSWKGKVSGITTDVDMDYCYDVELFKGKASSVQKAESVSDKEKFLKQAKTYIGKNGYYVCNTKLKLGAIYDWCAFAVSSIMRDCGFIRKYINAIQGGAGDIPRYSDGKYGTWFAKGTKTPQSGDLIFFRYAGVVPTDKYFSSHVGIVEVVNGNTLTTLEGNVEGQNGNWASTSSFKRKTRYLNNSDVYAFYRPSWKSTEAKPTTQTSNTSGTSSTVSADKNIDVFYQVYAKGRWLPWVKNLEDYAGLEQCKIQGIKIKASKGHVKYRVKLVSGKWLPWVTDDTDYAGIIGKNIDCVQIQLIDLDGYEVKYRVSLLNTKDYLPWVYDFNNVDINGYAGKSNNYIDKLQVQIIKK